MKPAVHISTSQKPSTRTTLKSVKKNETENNVRKNSSASKPNTMTYMQKKPSVAVSSTKTQQKTVENSQKNTCTQKVKSQGARQATVKQSKQTVKPTSKPLTTKQPAGKQATTKTQKVTDKTKTLTRKSRKNV